MKKKHQHAVRSQIIIPDVTLTSHITIATKYGLECGQKSCNSTDGVMTGDTRATVLPVHDRKWHLCFHIKANEHVMCGKGQASKPGDRCYMWTNNYVAATGIKGNFSVCQMSVCHHPPPSAQKCQLCGCDTSNCFLVLFSILQRIVDTTWQKKNYIKIDFILYWIIVTHAWEGFCWGSVPTYNINCNAIL